MVRTGTATTPIYERTIYIDGVFEYVILEDTSGTYEKNYIHIMDDKSRIAEVRVGSPFPDDISEDVVYIIDDQIGSSISRLDGFGSLIDREEYYPFGDSSLRTFTYKRYRYVGKERDSESGLYYYGARYYAAWTCRFISVDPIASDYPYYTPYNYAGNKPINKIDLEGLQEAEPATDDSRGGGMAESQDNAGQNTRADSAGTSNPPADAASAETGSSRSDPDSASQEGISGGVAGKTGKTPSDSVSEKGSSKSGGGVSGKSGGGGSGSSSGGGGGNGSTGTITDKAVNNTKTDTYEEYAYKTSQSALKRGDYMMWFEYRLKAGLGNDFDRKSEAALKPFADFVADVNPLLGIVNFLYSFKDGKDIYGQQVTASDRVLLLFGMFGASAFKSIKWLSKLGKPIEGIIQKASSHWHHLIPKGVFKKLAEKLAGLSIFKNALFNLKKLPAGFHGNHPQYNKWIEKQLLDLYNEQGFIDLDDLLSLANKATKEINKAYKIWLKNNKSKQYNLNEYFRGKK